MNVLSYFKTFVYFPYIIIEYRLQISKYKYLELRR